MAKLLRELIDPFQSQGKTSWPVLALFLLINALVFTNAVLHDPYSGYDAADHIQYIKVLATKRALPYCNQTSQCYVPPLPYILPAIALSSGRITLWQAAKLAQLLNGFLSLGLTFCLLKLCRVLIPRSVTFQAATLGMLGILPVYYRTFALIRGEPYLAFLCVFSAYQVVLITTLSGVKLGRILLLGLGVGLAILARQWGFLLLAALISYLIYASLRDRSKLRPAVFAILACLGGLVLVAGWYYFIMFQRYGTLLAAGWVRNAAGPSTTPLPLDFYLGTGNGKLFTDPVRPEFSNQLPAIFYADTWGDYGEYFLIYAWDRNAHAFIAGKYVERILDLGPPLPEWMDSNRFTFNAYLGRVNLVSLLPSAVFLSGLFLGIVGLIGSLKDRDPSTLQGGSALAVLAILISLAGYAWFLIRYQTDGQAGDLVKSSHMLQVFPFLALLAACLLERLRAWRRPAWAVLILALGLVYLHNIPAMLTHYVLPP